MKSLSLPHSGHKKIHSHNARGKEGTFHSKKSETKHRKHQPTIGAPRQMVPSPLQDFVLLSGSPLFHERSKASDNIFNASDTNGQHQIGGEDNYRQGAGGSQTPAPTKEHGQFPGQVTPHDQQGVSQTTSPTSQGHGQYPRPGQTSQTIQTPGQKTPSTHGHDLSAWPPASASENQEPGKGQEQQEGGGSDQGTNQKQTAMNGTVQLLSEANRAKAVRNTTSASSQSNITQVNAAVQITNLTVNGQRFGGSGIISLGQNADRNNASNAAPNLKIALQGENPASGHFPFNIPGVRHYGGDKTGDHGNEDIGKDHGKVGLEQNLAPHCHWKSTQGKDGSVITSVACSGEFSTSEGSKTEGTQKPLDYEHANPGGVRGVKEIPSKAGNNSGAGGIDVGKQVQSE